MPANAKPRDCIRILKEQQYKLFFENREKSKKPLTKRKVYDQTSAGFKHNNKNSFLETISNIEKIKLDDERRIDRDENPRLLNLVHECAYGNRHKKPSIDRAATQYSKAVQGVLTEIKKHTHHKNKTR
jgi:hypothetical protein